VRVSGIGSEFSPRHNEPFYRGGAGRKERKRKKKSFPSAASTVASEGSFEIMTRQWRCCELARSKRRQASATRNEKPVRETRCAPREREETLRSNGERLPPAARRLDSNPCYAVLLFITFTIAAVLWAG
jgi:hypothetical protein